jgi:hypothetical protein
MQHLNLADHAVAAHAKTTMAVDETAGRLVAAAADRRAHLLGADAERGSQTAEYAMVGGVGVAAAGALIALITKKDLLYRILEAIVTAIIKAVTSWF